MKAIVSAVIIIIISAIIIVTVTGRTSYVEYSYGVLKQALRYLLNLITLLISASIILYFLTLFYSLTGPFRLRPNQAHVEPQLEIYQQAPLVAESGDHVEEFFDMLEVAQEDPILQQPVTDQVDTSRETHRRRRRRMVSTLLWEDRDSLLPRNTAVRQSLREVEDLEFLTPIPSPRKDPSLRTESSPNDLNEFVVVPLQVNLSEESDQMQHPESCALRSGLVRDESTSRFSPVITTKPSNNSTVSEAIVLHQFPRGINKPCLSCDGMNVETYLRLIGASCDVCLDCLDTNGPWICCGSVKVFGVKNCVKFLKEFFPDITNLFTVSGERSLSAWSITLLVDHLYWGLKCWRWVIENADEFSKNQPGWSRICRNHEESLRSMRAELLTVGLGSMSYKEITEVILKDMESLSATLGKKSFLLGDTPTEVDCYAFSVLSQIIWGHESILRDKLKDHSDLLEYCIAMRDMLWPDWEDQLASNFPLTPSKMFKMSTNQYPTTTDTEDTQEDEVYTDSQRDSSVTGKTDFTKYYHLVSTAEDSHTFSQTESEINSRMTRGCSCDEDLLYVCTKCTRTEFTRSTVQRVQNTQVCTVGTRRVQNAQSHIGNNRNEPTRLIPDGDMIHSYGIEEYFDDDFEDMERISFTESNRESQLSPRSPRRL